MTPQLLNALRRLVETFDEHPIGALFLLGLTAICCTTVVLVACFAPHALWKLR